METKTMTTKTMFHVTDESNVDSILEDGPGDAGDVDEFVKHGAAPPVDLEVA